MKNKINLIAEIGWNHLGNIKLAKNMIKVAAKSGADYCKFQTWSEDNLKPGAWDNDGRRHIYKKAQLSPKMHYILKRECKKQNVKFLTSIFSLKDLDFLSILNPSAIKIPSHEIYNIELIKKCLKKFKLVLVSAGAAKWSEVKKIINLKSKKIVLMHCVSSYPLEANYVNFAKLKKIKKYTKNIGYSGHYKDIDDAIIAINMGANFVEKHFTTNNRLKGRDNKYALNPKKFKSLSDFRNLYLEMNINRGFDVQKCEIDIYKNYRGRWSN